MICLNDDFNMNGLLVCWKYVYTLFINLYLLITYYGLWPTGGFLHYSSPVSSDILGKSLLGIFIILTTGIVTCKYATHTIQHSSTVSKDPSPFIQLQHSSTHFSVMLKNVKNYKIICLYMRFLFKSLNFIFLSFLNIIQQYLKKIYFFSSFSFYHKNNFETQIKCCYMYVLGTQSEK